MSISPEQYQSLRRILFIDIETVSGKALLGELTAPMQALWQQRSLNAGNPKNLNPEELYRDRAALMAEFGKVVCIGLGYFYNTKDGLFKFRIKSITGDTEADLLKAFLQVLALPRYADHPVKLCAHNGKEFDYPYLCRRLLLNGLGIPPILHLHGRKPWEVPHLDTLEMWRFGERKGLISLSALGILFDIPGAELSLNGPDIHDAWYNLQQPELVQQTSMQHVALTAQVYLRMMGIASLETEMLEFVKG